MEEHSKATFNGHSRGSLKDYYISGSKRKVSAKSRSAKGSDLIEKIMSQCIVSGIILIIVLLICLVDTRFTIGARESIKSVLSGNMGVELIIDKFKDLTQTYAGVKNSFNTIFGGVSTDGELGEMLSQETDVTAADLNQAEISTAIEPTDPVSETSVKEIELPTKPAASVSPTPAPTNEPTETHNTAALATQTADPPTASNTHDDNFRIDEDILEEINSRVDFYYTRALNQ